MESNIDVFFTGNQIRVEYLLDNLHALDTLNTAEVDILYNALIKALPNIGKLIDPLQ